MIKVTSLEQQKKDRNRYNVYADGEFYCGLDADAVVKFSVRPGTEFSEDEFDEIIRYSENGRAFSKAVAYCTQYMKTEKQVRDYLRKHGFERESVDACVEKLKKYDLLDDLRYCRSYIEGAEEKGKYMIEASLRRRGASDDAVREAMEGYEESVDDALAVLEKYMRGKTCENGDVDKGYAHLIARGYGYDTAREAVRLFREGIRDEACADGTVRKVYRGRGDVPGGGEGSP